MVELGDRPERREALDNGTQDRPRPCKKYPGQMCWGQPSHEGHGCASMITP